MRPLRIARGLGLLLATSPLWYVPWTLYPAVFGKAPLFLLAVAVLAFLAAAGSAAPPASDDRSGRFLDGAVLAYALVFALAGFFGSDWWLSLWGNESRAGGAVLVIGLSLWYAAASRTFDGRTWRRFWWIVVLGAAAEAAVAVLEAAFPGVRRAFGETNRFSAFFGNPAYLGGYLALATFAAASLAARGTRLARAVLAALGLLLVAGVLLTGTRGAALAVAAGALAGCAAYAFAATGRMRLVAASAALGLVAASAALGLVASRATEGGLLAVRRVFTEPIGAARLINWRIALDAFAARPLLGWGPEAYQNAFDRHYRPELLKVAFNETVSDKPHNLLLETLATGGIPLLAAFLALLAAAAAIVRRSRSAQLHPFEAAGAVGFLVAYVVNGSFLFDTLPTSFLLFSLLAWLRGVPAETAEAPTVPGRRLVGLHIAVATFFLGAAAAYVVSIPASFAAVQAIRAEEPTAWTAGARRAAEAPSVHHREIMKQIVRDFLDREVLGAFPKGFFSETVGWLRPAAERAVRDEPEDFTMQFLLAQVLAVEGEYRESPEALSAAVDAFRAARALSPERQAVPLQLAKVLILGNKEEEAVALLRGLVAEDPSIAEPHWFLALALIASGDVPAGADEIKRSYDLGRGPRHVPEALYMIDVLVSAGRYDAVVPILQVLSQNDPRNPDWHARLAAAYAKAGKPELAIIEAQRAAEIDPAYRAEADAFIRGLEDAAAPAER